MSMARNSESALSRRSGAHLWGFLAAKLFDPALPCTVLERFKDGCGRTEHLENGRRGVE